MHSPGRPFLDYTTLIMLNVHPTSFFFSAIYSESLFFLFSILVYWFSARKRYILAGLFVSAASLTRVNGFLLAAIPVIEDLSSESRPPLRSWARAAGIIFTASLGLLLYGT